MVNWFLAKKTEFSKADPRTGKIDLLAIDGVHISCFIQEDFDIESKPQGSLIPVIENDEGSFVAVDVPLPDVLFGLVR